MTSGIPPIDSVIRRIDSIDQRFAPAARDRSLDVIPGPTFDPFGEVYEQAVAASRTAAANAATPIDTSTFNVARARLIPRTWSTTGVSGAGASSTGVQPRGSIGGFGPMPVPDELAAYGNGRVPADRLTAIDQSGHRLYAPAAAAWDRLVDAAAADGLDIRITDSYRSYENQVDLVRRKGLYSEGGLGAEPGTSNHGWGLAVDADVTDPTVLSWIREHGPEFGWVEAVPREPWHWEFRPHQT
jgi:zinc D-Ala-D-Ala carboxypeptidase